MRPRTAVDSRFSLRAHASLSDAGAAIKGNLDVAKVLHERGIGLRDLHEDGYEPMREWRRPPRSERRSDRDPPEDLTHPRSFVPPALRPRRSPVRACTGSEEKHTATAFGEYSAGDGNQTFQGDGHVAEDSYMKESIYAVLYSLYQNAGQVPTDVPGVVLVIALRQSLPKNDAGEDLAGSLIPIIRHNK